MVCTYKWLSVNLLVTFIIIMYHCMLVFSVPGTPPTITTFNVSSPYFVLVEWDPPSTPKGVITHYNLYVDYENGSNDTFIVEGQATVYNITDLIPFQFVSVEMSANTSVGEGPRCPQVTDQLPQACKHRSI